MSILWNLNDLQPPPTNTSKVKIQAKDVLHLHKVIQNFIEEFEKTQCINQEAAMLSRTIYRMKYKFRHDKGFKSMEKVNRALLQYLNMNYINYLHTFLNTIDTNDINDIDIYLPTKQMLEFLLVRTQGFSKLMQRIIESCEITAQYMSSRISIGQSWNLALMVLSNSSRIHFIANHLIKKSCEFYNEIFPYLQKLQPFGIEWLAGDYTFPANLFSWLDIQIESEQKQEILAPVIIKQNSTSTVNLNVDLGVQISRESFKAINEESKENKTVEHNNKKRSLTKLRNNIHKHNLLILNEKSLESKKNNHQVDHIKDFGSLKTFMKKEDKYRKSSNDKSLTKHLDLLQWKLLQKVVSKFMKKMVLAQDNKKTTIKLISKIKKILKNNIEN